MRTLEGIDGVSPYDFDTVRKAVLSVLNSPDRFHMVSCGRFLGKKQEDSREMFFINLELCFTDIENKDKFESTESNIFDNKLFGFLDIENVKSILSRINITGPLKTDSTDPVFVLLTSDSQFSISNAPNKPDLYILSLMASFIDAEKLDGFKRKTLTPSLDFLSQ